jgi:spore germination cell wall hydrolase CwlJ-like protein
MFEGKAIALTDSYIQVYSSADEASEPTGRMYNESMADTIVVGTDWTKISTGDLSGFVKTSQLCFNDEAAYVASESKTVTATVTTDAANVVLTPDTGVVLATASSGDAFQAVGINGNYIKVIMQDGTTGYVANDKLSVDYGFQTGLTNEEAEAKEAAEAAAKAEAEKAAQEAEAARAAAEAAQKAEAAKKAQAIANAQVTYNPTMSVSNDEVWLLATIVDWEAGNESYQGKLAVANVVLNRVRSSKYAGTITGVIYAKGQFSGVADGSGNPTSAFAARLASGPSSGSMNATLDALSGTDNIGSFTSFRTIATANVSAYSSYQIIGNHCFY